MSGDIYLGLDLSMSSPGFAAVEVVDRQPRLVAASHVKTNAKKKHGERLEQIREGLGAFFAAHAPYTEVIREKGFSRHAQTTQVLFKVVGLSDWLLRESVIEELPPPTVKKLVSGNARADKKEVEEAVRVYLALPNQYEFKTDDESDACAVALAYLLQKKKIDEKIIA